MTTPLLPVASAASATCDKAPASGKAAAALTTARREISGVMVLSSLIGSPPLLMMMGPLLRRGREFLVGHRRGLGPDDDVEAELRRLMAAVAAGGEIVEGGVELGAVFRLHGVAHA